MVFLSFEAYNQHEVVRTVAIVSRLIQLPSGLVAETGTGPRMTIDVEEC